MKDGMEYAEMLGLTVSSCDVVVKPARKRKRANVKEDVIKRVNENLEEETVKEIDEKDDKREDLTEYEEVGESVVTSTRKKFKFDIVYAQGVAIFALIVTILLTNIFWENSGINNLFKRAFGGGEEILDTRTYLSFSAKAPSGELTASVEDGVMTFSGKGALYPVCDGKVTSIVEEDGKYTLTVKHSESFSTVISGVDFVYTETGADVFAYIPVCFIGGGDASVYMYDNQTLLTNYIVEDGVIIWES